MRKDTFRSQRKVGGLQFPGYADRELTRLADVPDVAVSATAMVRLAEAANSEESMLTEREISSRERERPRKLRELAREEGRFPDSGAVLPP